MEYNCLNCGIKFQAVSKNRKYCSISCGQRKPEGKCLDCGVEIRLRWVRCEDCRNKIRDSWPEKLKVLRRKKSYEIGRQPRGRWQHLKRFLKRESVPLTDPLWSKNFYTALIEDARCVYCLKPLNPTGHGLDRKNNLFGHEAWNVVPCCKKCNAIKGKYWEYEHMMLISFKLRNAPNSSKE